MKQTIAILIALTPGLAIAGDNDERKVPTDQGAHVFSAANALEVVQYTDSKGNTRPACFKYGLEIKLTSSGGRTASGLVIDDAVTFEGDIGDANEATIVDAATYDGGGPGAQLVANERETLRVDYEAIYRAPGARAGLCSGFIEGPGRYLVRQGCDATADCAVGTCDTNATAAQRKDFGCAILVSQGASTATQLLWRVMEARK